MLMIRHTIGSRLLFQTDQYNIERKGDFWGISTLVDEKSSSQIMYFREELNIFEVSENEKAWYYSSDAQIDFQPTEQRLVILADHKTVYPVK
ncbi:MAG TPA: hypothetical protein VNM45_20445 [Bacillus sp. (in: firmicutes)]|nr:hypothetical protein [Bacillus sp. (in: firmicutes)]